MKFCLYLLFFAFYRKNTGSIPAEKRISKGSQKPCTCPIPANPGLYFFLIIFMLFMGGCITNTGWENVHSAKIMLQDENNDGRIGKTEAKGSLLGYFDYLDINSDGYIEESELAAFREPKKEEKPSSGKKVTGARKNEKPATPEKEPNSSKDRTASSYQTLPAPGAGKAQKETRNGNFRVIVLTSGCSRGPAVLVQYQNHNFLVNMPDGVCEGLLQAGVSIKKIDTLVLTRHFFETAEEFPRVLGETMAEQGKRIYVLGPRKTENYVEFVLQFQQKPNVPEKKHPSPNVIELGEKGKIRLNGVVIESMVVSSAPLTLAYRFVADGKSIVILEDSGLTKKALDFIQKADLFVTNTTKGLDMVMAKQILLTPFCALEHKTTKTNIIQGVPGKEIIP